MDLSGVRALSFDCYGTLIDWETGLLRVLEAWRRRRKVQADRADLLALFGRHEATEQAAHPSDLYPTILSRAFSGVGAELGVTVTEADAADLAGSVPDWPAFADSRDALATLGRRFVLLVLSNVDNRSFGASNARLGHPFASILTAENIGSYKPDPKNFVSLIERARDAHDVAPTELVHVAQSRYHDIAPAHEAGLRTVWVTRGGPGAVQTPQRPVTPTWRFETLAAFAAAATQ